MNAVTTNFTYAALPLDLAEDIRAAASNIRTRFRDSIFEIGEQLSFVQEHLDHGQFVAWLDAEFSMSVSSAYNYLSAYKEFGDKILTVGKLPPKAIYMLASRSTPTLAKSAILDQLAAGKVVTTDEVKDAISEAKAAAGR